MDHLKISPASNNSLLIRIPYVLDRYRNIQCDSEEVFTTPIIWSQYATRTNDCNKHVQKLLYFSLISFIFRQNVDISEYVQINQRILDTTALKRHLTNWDSQTTERLDLVLPSVEHHLQDYNRIIEDFADSHSLETSRLICLSVRVLIDSLVRAAKLEVLLYHHLAPTSVRGLFRSIMPVSKGWCPLLVTELLNKYTCATVYYLASMERSTTENHHACTETDCGYKLDEEKYEISHVTNGCSCGMISVALEDVKDIIKANKTPVISYNHHIRTIKVIEASSDQPYVAISHPWSGGLGNPRGNALPQCRIAQLSEFSEQLQADELKQNILSREAYGEKDDELLTGLKLPFLYMFKAVQVLRSQSTTAKEKWESRKAERNLFWIDTLCVPRSTAMVPQEVTNDAEKEKQSRLKDEVEALRKITIENMTRTYGEAVSVLIMDPELKTIARIPSTTDSPLNPDIYVCGRLLCSAWKSRCWTLLEATMARRLHVRLVDGAYPVRVLNEFDPREASLGGWPALRRDRDLQRERELHTENVKISLPEPADEIQTWVTTKSKLLRQIFDLQQSEFDVNIVVFRNMWNTLGFLRTSFHRDRIYILCVMLGLLPSEVLDKPPSDPNTPNIKYTDEEWDKLETTRRLKMILAYQSLSELPLSLLFHPSNTSNDRHTYCLPNDLTNWTMTAHHGIMKRDKFEDEYLYFNFELLYGLTPSMEQPRLVYLAACDLSRSQNSVTGQHGLLAVSIEGAHSPYSCRNQSIVLVMGDDPSTERNRGKTVTGACFLLEQAEQQRNTLSWLRYIGPIKCYMSSVCENSLYNAEFEAVSKDIEYRIRCEFRGIRRLRGHPFKGYMPLEDSAAKITGRLDFWILVYYLFIALPLISIISLLSKPRSFSPYLLIVLGFLFFLRSVASTMLPLLGDFEEKDTPASELAYYLWLNEAVRTDGSHSFQRRQKVKFSPHPRFGTALCILFFGSIFSIAGIPGYKHSSGSRWCLAFGLSILCEFLWRWVIEIFGGRVFGFRPSENEHSAYYEKFLSPSWATKKVRSVLCRKERVVAV